MEKVVEHRDQEATYETHFHLAVSSSRQLTTCTIRHFFTLSGEIESIFPFSFGKKESQTFSIWLWDSLEDQRIFV